MVMMAMVLDLLSDKLAVILRNRARKLWRVTPQPFLLGADLQIAVMAPEISRHRRGRQKIANQYRQPRDRVQNRFRENHRCADEAELKDDEEEQNAKTYVHIALGNRQQLKGNAADHTENQAMDPGVDEYHLERNGERLRLIEPSAVTEERRAQHVRRVEERVSANQVDKEKPNCDRGRAEDAGFDALPIGIRDCRCGWKNDSRV